MKERVKCQKMSHHLPNDSRDIPSQSEEQDGRCHFVDFQPHFRVIGRHRRNQQIMKKRKCNILRVFCSIGLQFCRLLELSKGILLDFKFSCCGNQNQNNCLLLRKTKGLLFKRKYFSENNLKQYSLIITAGNIIF